MVSAKETIAEGSKGILLESVLEGMAEYYSAGLSEKVKRDLIENALKCKYNGGSIPIGYKIDNEQKLQIGEEFAPLIVEMYYMCSDGKTAKDIYK